MNSIEKVRNFCIIAHIDHGKSTLADRLLEMTGTIESSNTDSQVLDDMDLEKERGITIKSRAINMRYKHSDGDTYSLNLIDTPGHVDFSYEVSRSLAACDGAILIVDATQGVEAQTVSNLYLAVEANLEIIPVLNKIDVDNNNIENAQKQLIELIGCDEDQIVRVSAKTGMGVSSVLDKIIDIIPSPIYNEGSKTRALIFDSSFDRYRGVIVYVRVNDGYLSKGMTAKLFNSSERYEILEVGILRLDREPCDKLTVGDVGYVIMNIKEISDVNVGDTLTVTDNLADTPLEGYQEIKPMVFSGMYPVDSNDYEDLKTSIEKLKLNDSALSYEPNTSTALGFGFRCGFLGPLHMEIVQERLEREFNMNLITTSPNVKYNLLLKDGSTKLINNPSDMPHTQEIDKIFEPYINAEIISPSDYIGPIMKLCLGRRGTYRSTNYISESKVQLAFAMPLAEVIYDFFESLKSMTQGYASFDYSLIDEQPSKLVRLDIKIAGDNIDALSMIIHESNSYQYGAKLCKKLKDEIHRQQFDIPVQAAIGQKIIARETVKALRKNVTAKCYGGDISRKRKLLEKQKKGKKRMKQLGKVELPQEAFLAVLKVDND